MLTQKTKTADFALQTVAIGAEAEIRVRGYEGESRSSEQRGGLHTHTHALGLWPETALVAIPAMNWHILLVHRSRYMRESRTLIGDRSVE